MSELAFLDRYKEAKARLWGEAIAKNPPAKVVVKRVHRHKTRDWLFLSSWVYAAREPSTPVSKASSIVEEVCREHDIAEQDLLGKRRQPHLVAARFDVYARLVAETNWSLMRIGEFLGRDHSTIVKSLARHNPHMMRRSS